MTLRPVVGRSQVCYAPGALLKGLRQFGCESALGFLIALPAAATVVSITLVRSGSGHACSPHGTSLWRGTFGRLSRVCTKDLIFERGSIEPANNRLHFVRR